MVVADNKASFDHILKSWRLFHNGYKLITITSQIQIPLVGNCSSYQ